MNLRRSAWTCVAMLMVVAVGCGDDGPNDQLAAVEAAAAPVAATVRWGDGRFDPDRVDLAAGSAIEIVNDSSSAVRFVADGYDTGSQTPGDTVRLAFTEPGIVTFLPFAADGPALTINVAEP